MTDKIMFINTQGFQNKKDKLNEIVKTKQPMVLAIAEHFQNNQDLLSCIEGYTVRSSFCRELKNERGGVAIFVRNDVECKPREELDVYCQKKAFEVATVEIPSINLVVSAMYKPPSSSRTKFYSNLDSLLETLKSDTDKKHIIAGDFNIDLSQNKSTNEVMQKNGFKSTLSESTHDYGACYDNFIVDFEPRKARVMRGKFDKISDHHPIELIIGTRSSKAEKDTNSAPPSQTSKESALSSHSESNENTVTSTTNITSKTKEVVPSKQSSPTLSERVVSSSKNSKTNSKNIIPTKPSPISTLESDVSSSNNSKLKMKKITNSKISSSQSTSSEFNVSATSNRKPKAEKGIPSTESSATAEKDTNSPPPSQTSKESASSSHSESNENTVTSTTKITSKTKKVVPSKQSSPTLSERAVSSSKNSKTNSKNIIPTKPSPISTLESDVSSSNNSKLKMKKITNSKISSSQSTSSEFNDSATSNLKSKAEKGMPSTESSATLLDVFLGQPVGLDERNNSSSKISSPKRKQIPPSTEYHPTSATSFDLYMGRTHGLEKCDETSYNCGLNDSEILLTRNTNTKRENIYTASTRPSRSSLDSISKPTRSLNDVETSSIRSTKPKGANKYTLSMPSPPAPLESTVNLTRGLHEMEVSSTRITKPKFKKENVLTQPSSVSVQLDSISSLSSDIKRSGTSSTRTRKPKTIDVLYDVSYN